MARKKIPQRGLLPNLATLVVKVTQRNCQGWRALPLGKRVLATTQQALSERGWDVQFQSHKAVEA